jgi:hypothetical protein
MSKTVVRKNSVRSVAARKAVETRKANVEAERLSEIALRAVATRRANAKKRAAAAKKAVKTRRARSA